MNRRELIKRGGLTVAALGLGITTTGCPTKQLQRWTNTVIVALEEMIPILTEMGQVAIVAVIERALPIAKRLKKAFEDNNNASALELLNDLINPQDGVIVELARMIDLGMTEGPKKKLILGLLSIAQLTLRLIAANIVDNVPPAVVNEVKARKPAQANGITKAAATDFYALFKATRF